MSKLQVVEGPLRGKVFEVTELASIGRGETCAVRLDGRHISRIHARLEKSGEGMLLKDNGSRNGIFVNGQALKEALLRPDDEIEIGEHVLVFDPTSDPEKKPRAAATVVEGISDPFAPGASDERFEKVPAVAASITSMDAEKEIAKSLLEALLLAIQAERGFVMVADEEGQLQPAARKAPAGEEEFYLSNVLHHQMSKERRAVIALDTLRRQPNLGKAISILAVPLWTKSGFLGLAYLDVKLPDGDKAPRFKAADLRLASMLAAFASIRIQQIRRVPARGRIGETPLAGLVKVFERECVAEALRQTKGELIAAAKLLGLPRLQLDEKLKALGMVGQPTELKPADRPTAVKPAPAAPAAPKPPDKPASSGPAEWKSVQV
jgi:pSer/pThr/pTyr-binding forkhead associated (FHA) protein